MTNKIEELKKIDNKHLIPNVEEYIKTIEQEERKKTLAEVERAWCDFYNEFDLASDCTRDDKLFKRLWRKYHGELNMVNHRGIKFPMVSIAEVEKMIKGEIMFLDKLYISLKFELKGSSTLFTIIKFRIKELKSKLKEMKT